jgi:hypothetical protein
MTFAGYGSSPRLLTIGAIERDRQSDGRTSMVNRQTADVSNGAARTSCGILDAEVEALVRLSRNAGRAGGCRVRPAPLPPRGEDAPLWRDWLSRCLVGATS